jgi:hypothetical protein
MKTLTYKQCQASLKALRTMFEDNKDFRITFGVRLNSKGSVLCEEWSRVVDIADKWLVQFEGASCNLETHAHLATIDTLAVHEAMKQPTKAVSTMKAVQPVVEAKIAPPMTRKAEFIKAVSQAPSGLVKSLTEEAAYDKRQNHVSKKEAAKRQAQYERAQVRRSTQNVTKQVLTVQPTVAKTKEQQRLDDIAIRNEQMAAVKANSKRIVNKR